MKGKIIGLILGFIIWGNCLAKIELIVFVSFSMPENALVGLSADAGKVDGALMLRGFVKDSRQATNISLKGIIKQSGWGMIINPEYFKELNIKEVPTFVLADFGFDGVIKSFDKVSGNVTLDYALEEIAKHGEHYNDARILLDRLRRNGDS